MRQWKRFLTPTLFSKNLNPFSILIGKPKTLGIYFGILNKIVFLESNLKSRHFKDKQDDLPFPEYLKKLINKFPYCKIPKYTQKFSEQNQLQQEDYQMLVAFNSLFVVNQANKQRQLKEMAKILLKQDFAFLGNQNLTGTQVFSLYYGKKLAQIVKQLNQNQLPDEKKTFYFQVLTNLSPTPQVKNFIQKLKEQLISKANIHIQALYTKLLLKHELPYIHFIDKVYSQLTKDQSLQSTQIQKSLKLQAAKTFLTIQNFEQVLPQNLKTACLNYITENISSIEAFDHFMIIKLIYLSNSEACKQYIETLTQQIMNMHKSKKGDQLHIPLLLKVIKYRSKLHLNNKMFLQIINAYPQKFSTVFREKNINKEVFLSLTTKDNNNQLNPQIKSEFGLYIKKVFEDYEKKEQLDEDELIRNIKLLLKYGYQANKQQALNIIEILVKNLYERTKHAASQQLKYYIFLTCYTFNPNEKLTSSKSFIQLTKQVTQIYHNKCLTQPDSQSLSKMINIQYQLCRKQADKSLRHNIFEYNYENAELVSSVYSYLFYLMKKEKSKGTDLQKKNVLNQLKKNIYRNLSNGNCSMKIIYTLIDVLDELKFEDKFIYVDLERAIAKNLERGLNENKKKTSDLPLPKDIQFFKHKLVNNKKCSSKFSQFIIESQKNYTLINNHIKDYLEKSRNWENMRQNYKRNKQGQEKRNFNKYENSEQDIRSANQQKTNQNQKQSYQKSRNSQKQSDKS